MASTFVENCSHAAVGMICHDDLALAIATTAGQGSASAFFLSIGDDIERRADRFVAERMMNVLATCVGLVAMAAPISGRGASLDTLADLASFFAGRIRHMDLPALPPASAEESR